MNAELPEGDVDDRDLGRAHSKFKTSFRHLTFHVDTTHPEHMGKNSAYKPSNAGRSWRSVGHDKIRYLLFKKGRWRWRPTKTMRDAGFRPIGLSRGLIIDGENVPSPEDVTKVTQLNQD